MVIRLIIRDIRIRQYHEYYEYAYYSRFFYIEYSRISFIFINFLLIWTYLPKKEPDSLILY